jgi:hypothetical protein
VGLRGGLDRCGKSRLPPGFDPRTVQPIGSRYTNYTTRPAVLCIVCEKMCTVLLPPGVNPIAVNKYIYVSIYLITYTSL